MSLVEWLRKLFTPVMRYCKRHASESKTEYFIHDEENCMACLNAVVEVKFRRKK